MVTCRWIFQNWEHQKSISKPLNARNGRNSRKGGKRDIQVLKLYQMLQQKSCKSQSRKACSQPVHSSASRRRTCFIAVTDFHLLRLNSEKRQRQERRLMSDATKEPQTSRVPDGDSAAVRRRHRCCRLVLIAADEPQHSLTALKKKVSAAQAPTSAMTEGGGYRRWHKGRVSNLRMDTATFFMNLSFLIHNDSIHKLRSTPETWQQRSLVSELVGTVKLRKCRCHHRFQHGLSWGSTWTWAMHGQQCRGDSLWNDAHVGFFSFFNTNLIRSAICQWFQTVNLLLQTFSRRKLKQVWVYYLRRLRWVMI